MIRVGRLIKISGMAVHAKGRSAGVTIDVASCAFYGSMGPSEGEVGLIMIKISGLPGILIVTSHTFGRISHLLMIGISGCIIIIDMATGAGIGCIGIVSIVASGTVIGYGGMGPFNDIIITVDRKSRRTPTGLGGMTRSTIIGKCEFGMIRVRRLIKVSGMAVYTDGGGTGICICMATGAFCGGMCPSEGEVG